MAKAKKTVFFCQNCGHRSQSGYRTVSSLQGMGPHFVEEKKVCLKGVGQNPQKGRAHFPFKLRQASRADPDKNGKADRVAEGL